MELIHRLQHIAADIKLGMNCELILSADNFGVFFQIKCWRPDAFTGVMDWGYGGKIYPSSDSSDDQIVASIFGLYKGYWEHEARETFKWQGVRIYGPHIKIAALKEAARHVDIPGATQKGHQ